MPKGSSGGATGVSSPPHTSSLAISSWTRPFSSEGGVAQTDVALSLVGREALWSQDANWDRLQSQFRGFSEKNKYFLAKRYKTFFKCVKCMDDFAL